MAENTLAVDLSDPIAATPSGGSDTDTQPETISVDEANRRGDRMAKSAREEGAAEAKATSDAALAEANEKLAKHEADAKERAEAEMSEVELRTERDKERDKTVRELTAQAAALAEQQAQSATDAGELAKTTSIAKLIASSPVRVPGPYQAAVYATLAEVDELNQAAVDTALTTAQEGFKAEVEALGFAPASTPNPTGTPAGGSVGDVQSVRPIANDDEYLALLDKSNSFDPEEAAAGRDELAEHRKARIAAG